MDSHRTDPQAHDFGSLQFDGYRALEAIVATSPYKSVSQAVASLTVFSHPQTVAQTRGRAVVPVVRTKDMGRRGKTDLLDGQIIGLDDNKAPTDVFLWCNGIKRRPRDVQFNHVHKSSGDPDAYTSLANLCMTPSFIAKLTDTNEEIQALLKYRAWDLYAWRPRNLAVPIKPDGYTDIRWPTTLRPADAATEFAAVMERRPKDRTTRFAMELGTVFDVRLSTAGRR